ncbi:winged helix-turn-helix domain-containing protein [Haloprofundus salinisoli]|uniref:winged helix-turn-helix domain-containing protein n=1 Tax=Haloprofundus salinisoli TaxID=2876193 RepID=UPI001CCD911F|nr:winged helix-turn-helix domain-containing protein [Haloprofundus salinisoli]
MNDSFPAEWGRGTATVRNEAFQLLSDKTRLKILQTLWEVHDPTDPAPIRFSDLRERVDVDDPGRLNYHLKKLSTHFVHHSDGGYELREAGKRIIRVVIAGTAIDEVTIEPIEIAVSCIFCGGPTTLEYENGLLSHWCTSCTARCVASYPAGLLSSEEHPPAGMLNRTPSEVYRSHRVWIKHREASVMEGVCPECSGPMPVESIRICDDHAPDPEDEDVCDECGSIFWGIVYHMCDVCKFVWKLPTLLYPPTHPAVIAFYYDHGVEFDLASHEQRARLLEYQEKVVSKDPLRLRTTISIDGDELRITFDEQMTVVDVNQGFST